MVLAFDGKTIFTVGGGAAGDQGNVVNSWAVNTATLGAAPALGDAAAAGHAAASDVRLAAGASTRPLFSSTRAVSDTKYTLHIPLYPRTPPKRPPNNP